MIPPNKFISIQYWFSGTHKCECEGKHTKEEYYRFYDEFLENPESNQHPEYFQNTLSKTEEKVLYHGKFCIVVVSQTYRGYDSKKTEQICNLLKSIAKNFDSNKLIMAWDAFFKTVDNILDRCAVIGIDNIMNVKFDKEVMVPGNIFIVENGIVTQNNLSVDDAIRISIEKNNSMDNNNVDNVDNVDDIDQRLDNENNIDIVEQKNDEE